MKSALHPTSYGGRGTCSPLRVYRVARGLTQRDLAELAGVREETIGRIETGRHLPRLSTVQAIAHVLGTTSDSLVPPESR